MDYRRYPFFQVTKTMFRPGDCMGWYTYLRGNGVPCAIVKQDGWYAVWRMGREALDGNGVVMTGTVMEECHEYALLEKIAREGLRRRDGTECTEGD